MCARKDRRTGPASPEHLQFCSPELSCPVPRPAAPCAGGTEVAPCCAGLDREVPQLRDCHSRMGTGSSSWLLGVSTPRSSQIWSQGLPGCGAVSSPSAAPRSWAATATVPQPPQSPCHFSPVFSSTQGVPEMDPVSAPAPGSAPHPARPPPRPISQPTGSGMDLSPSKIGASTSVLRAAEQNKTAAGRHGGAFLPPLSLLCLPSWVLHGSGRSRHPRDARADEAGLRRANEAGLSPS